MPLNLGDRRDDSEAYQAPIPTCLAEIDTDEGKLEEIVLQCED